MIKDKLNKEEQKIYEAVKKNCNFIEQKAECSIVLQRKAQQSQVCFEMLKKELNLKSVSPVVFCADSRRFEEMIESCFKELTYPEPLIKVFIEKRLEGILKLFQDEKVLQTAPLAAILAACANEILEICQLEGIKIDKEAPIYSDVAYAGLQAVRLYFTSTFDLDFLKVRAKSFTSVNNALNGILYKYRTKDGRDFSFHNYYESQKAKVAKALGFNKDPKDINMMSTKEDKAILEKIVKTYMAEELEEFTFDNGGSACMIRNRSEWESTEVGGAVTDMPLLKINKYSDTQGLKGRKIGGTKGPLEGLKILDFTHIIAGPACSRLLAEYGAEVLLVRRKELFSQEQSFAELDGWAGKQSIDLDLEDPESLQRVKDLIKEADVVTYSYQNNAFDKFGLSREDILALNPNLIYASMMCFSESIWNNRPGWAPLAEDITGLSIRNGSQENPQKLNGVPLDYIPGLILALGTLEAIKRSLKNGGAYTVMTSLTRGAVWLHQCTDLCETSINKEVSSNWIAESPNFKEWASLTHHIKNNATGDVGFPSSAVAGKNLPDFTDNMNFYDKKIGF